MSDHRWTFFRAGGVDQVVLKTGADLLALPQLDKKLWVSLACPTKGTEIDEKTLALLDTDKDGMLRPPEVLAAVAWAGKAFKALDFFFDGGEDVSLSSLDASTDEGKAVLRSAKQILADQEKTGKSVSLADVDAVQESFVKTRFNGDGVVPPDAAESDDVRAAIEDVMKGAGEVTDRSGRPGVDRALVDRYFTDLDARLAWAAERAASDTLGDADATARAASALAAIDAKAEDFFTRCHIAAFDDRGARLLGATDEELSTLAATSLATEGEQVAKLPIARISEAGKLPLESGINPAWRARVAAFRSQAVEPILGKRAVLTEPELFAIRERLAAFRAWGEKKGAWCCDAIDDARAKELVDGGFKDKIVALIESDLAVAEQYEQIVAVEKAIRLRRDFVKLLRNLVNFADFYGLKKGSFQAGTLFLDARSCDLCVAVNDPAKHAALAALSKAYLVYCDCTRASGEKIAIVCAFTAGDVDNLMVGRNGVFYDRKGLDWSATITSIVENPISIRQAFWMPYKRLIRLVEETFAKRAAEKDKSAMAKVDAGAGSVAKADQAAATSEPPKKLDIGIVAAIGVAVAGVAGFLTTVIAMFLGLGVYMPLGILALLLAISGPSMLIAWLKLRQRNLGPILDANGWAVNAAAKINIPLGTALTQLRVLPAGSSRATDDPFAEKPTPWALYIVVTLLLALGVVWVLGKADRWLPERARASHVFATTPPAPPAPPATPAPASPPAK